MSDTIVSPRDFGKAEAVVLTAEIGELIALAVSVQVVGDELNQEIGGDITKLPAPVLAYMERVDAVARQYQKYTK